MKQLLIFLSEKIIYGYVFHWSIEIIRLIHDLENDNKLISHFLGKVPVVFNTSYFLLSPDMSRLVSRYDFLFFREFKTSC